MMDEPKIINKVSVDVDNKIKDVKNVSVPTTVKESFGNGSPPLVKKHNSQNQSACDDETESEAGFLRRPTSIRVGDKTASSLSAGIVKSASEMFVRELQSDDNKRLLSDNVILPIVDYVTSYLSQYIKEQFYTQFILIVSIVVLLFVFNLILVVMMFWQRYRR
jgi:hypothetical protein